jgi:hypothetical protein
VAGVESLASYQRIVRGIRGKWGAFTNERQKHLEQQRRNGEAAEKVAENILASLFTTVLDWRVEDLNYQLHYADIVLTYHGVKRLLIEVKRPNALAWHRSAVNRALEQAWGYAKDQRVKTIAVSDGTMLYAADLAHPDVYELHDRVFVPLDGAQPAEDLWWLSVDGIYRPRLDNAGTALDLLPHLPLAQSSLLDGEGTGLLHPKYNLPSACFAYVGNPARTGTWKLPYMLADGHIDEKRLPKAIQAVLSNYRGVGVQGLPEEAVPAVLLTLARAAHCLHRLPENGSPCAPVYQLLVDALDQLGKRGEVVV